MVISADRRVRSFFMTYSFGINRSAAKLILTTNVIAGTKDVYRGQQRVFKLSESFRTAYSEYLKLSYVKA